MLSIKQRVNQWGKNGILREENPPMHSEPESQHGHIILPFVIPLMLIESL